jgi:ribosomal 50S subunit-associated protein YjgA (DUF615 family)
MRETPWIGEDIEAMKALTCEEAVREFFAYLDRAMAGEPLDALQQHLDQCLDCCDRLQFSRKLDAFVKERLEEAPLPEGFEEKIRRVLGD